MQSTITSILSLLALISHCAQSMPVAAPLQDSGALAVSPANNNNPSVGSTKITDTTDGVQDKKGGRKISKKGEKKKGKKGGFKKFWKVSSGIAGAFGSALTAGSAADQIKQRHDQQN